jgi:hypothetical protein
MVEPGSFRFGWWVEGGADLLLLMVDEISVFLL